MAIMYTTTITATELKNNTADVLNRVYYGGETVLVKRRNKLVVKLARADKKKKKLTKKEAIGLIKSSFGKIPDFPDVTKMRYSRDRDFEL